MLYIIPYHCCSHCQKSALAFAAALRDGLWRGLTRFAIDRPDTGTLRGDVIAILTQLSERQSDEVIVLAKYSIGASWLGINGHELYRRTALSERPSIAMAIDNARERGELVGELLESLMHMPGDLGRAAIIRDMRPLAEADIVAVVDELFLPLVRYYEAQSGDTME